MAQGKTPIFDWEKGEFKVDSQGAVLIAEDAQALEQIMIKAQQTPRNTYLIYANPENPELNHKYGSDVFAIMLESDLTDEERDSEIQRAIKEALVYDPWIKDITDISLTYDVDENNKKMVYASYTAVTIFDNITVKGAVVSG